MANIDRARLAEIRRREETAFLERTPRSRAFAERAAAHLPNGVPMTWMTGLYRTPTIYASHGDGPVFTDLDGNGYLDFNLCDLSMTMGFGTPEIAEAVAEAARRGAHFLLPSEDSVQVAELLAERVGLPFWQFTLSASGANAEVIRTARTLTGRDKVLIFDGHYHGHIDEMLVSQSEDGETRPGLLGLTEDSAKHTVVQPFNDLDALEARLAMGDIALVLTEPALTNCTLVLPEPGFLEGLRRLTRQHGSLLCYDEAHSFQFAYGGLVGAWRLESDFVVLGKGLGTGVSFALYGMSEAVGRAFAERSDVDIGPEGIATGGTTYASSIAVAAARATLERLLTPEAYDRTETLGGRLSNGLDGIFARLGLSWRAHRLGPRSGYCLFPDLPKTGAQGWQSIDTDFIDSRRLYLANRDIWDSIATSGPQVSLAHGAADVDRYLAAAADFLAEAVG